MKIKELMKQPLTPEIVMEMGQQWLEAHLARLPVDERLKDLKPQEVLKPGLRPEGETHA
jgi:predicted RNase H-like HicB family nuclease